MRDSERFNGKYKTRGVSTTQDFEIAKKYANRNKIIVKINTEKFNELGIDTNKVKNQLHPSKIIKLDDKEIILTYKNNRVFPSCIIEEIIKTK